MQSVRKDLSRWRCSEREVTAHGWQCDKTQGSTRHPSVTVMASLSPSVKKGVGGTPPWQYKWNYCFKRVNATGRICMLATIQQVNTFCLGELTDWCGLCFKCSGWYFGFHEPRYKTHCGIHVLLLTAHVLYEYECVFSRYACRHQLIGQMACVVLGGQGVWRVEMVLFNYMSSEQLS